MRTKGALRQWCGKVENGAHDFYRKCVTMVTEPVKTLQVFVTPHAMLCVNQLVEIG